MGTIWLLILGLSAIPIKTVKIIPGATRDEDMFEFVERWPLWGYERPAIIPTLEPNDDTDIICIIDDSADPEVETTKTDQPEMMPISPASPPPK